MQMNRYFEERYEILESIGEGGEGRIFKAYDHAVDRYVAIKELSLSKKGRAEVLKEARAIARISHPNVVSLYDIIEEEDRIYLIMEFVDGVSLRELLDDFHALPFQPALGIFIQVAWAIEFAHNHGIIHLDIKPENILVTPSGRVKIADFGIARFITEEEQTDKIMGTTHYLAPEALKGQYSLRSDIFALGTVLYEMLAGENPFYSYDPDESFKKILDYTPVPLSQLRSDIPEEFDSVLKKAMEKHPVRRYKDVTRFRIKVERFFDYETPEEAVKELFEEEERLPRKPILPRTMVFRLREKIFQILSLSFLSPVFSVVSNSTITVESVAFAVIALVIAIFSPALAGFIAFGPPIYWLASKNLTSALILAVLAVITFSTLRDLSRQGSLSGLALASAFLSLEAAFMSALFHKRNLRTLLSGLVFYASGSAAIFILGKNFNQTSILLFKLPSSEFELAVSTVAVTASAFIAFILSKTALNNIFSAFSPASAVFSTTAIAIILSETGTIPAYIVERLSISFAGALFYGVVKFIREKQKQRSNL